MRENNNGFSSICSGRKPSGINDTEFYQPNILSVVQPIVPKYWIKHKALTPTSGLASTFFLHHRTPDGRSTDLFMSALDTFKNNLSNEQW